MPLAHGQADYDPWAKLSLQPLCVQSPKLKMGFTFSNNWDKSKKKRIIFWGHMKLYEIHT